MALWQGKSRRKPTGGRLKTHRGKRKFEIGSELQIAVLGEQKRKFARTRGNNKKVRILGTDLVNVTDTKTNKTIRTKIVDVVKNPANPFYVRRDIITKGAFIETELGLAKITSRPGQHGAINAILVKKA